MDLSIEALARTTLIWVLDFPVEGITSQRPHRQRRVRSTGPEGTLQALRDARTFQVPK
jgi:hypothetical protein